MALLMNFICRLFIVVVSGSEISDISSISLFSLKAGSRSMESSDKSASGTSGSFSYDGPEKSHKIYGILTKINENYTALVNFLEKSSEFRDVAGVHAFGLGDRLGSAVAVHNVEDGHIHVGKA